MTRINCIPPSELTDKHLGAEYRELPRVFTLAYNSYARGDDPSKFPAAYVLGGGHVKFFYTRLGYLQKRYNEIVSECLRRGRRVSFMSIPDLPQMPTSWWCDWEPDEAAQQLNRARISERLDVQRS
jgi:hypothetical protein